MIEVESRFKLTDLQLEEVINDSVFMEDVVIHDIYYDYSDFRLFKNKTRLRKRNGNFELKIGQIGEEDEELEDQKLIEEYFRIADLDTFVGESLFPVIEYETKRSSYKNGKIRIDVDRTNFDYQICEVEILVENTNDIVGARREISEFAKRYGFENQKALPKRREFLRRFNGQVYKEIYGE